MQINGLHQNQAIQSIQSTSAAKPAESTQAAEAASSTPADQLDLSPEAMAISQTEAVDTAGIRMDKVAAIRQAIAEGTYETPEKMSAALDKMLDSFA